MGSRREEERNEKIIRGLMKLPPNRKCINCNSVGPQYVCTNFWTFICLSCSGIHREFTHRVKSVSMAKFTTQEVRALEQGGNQRARDIYLKDWDWQRMRLPDNSNPDRIREFIRTVYVDKKYAGGKSSNKTATDSESVKSTDSDMRRPSSYHSYSQSPPYDFQYEDRRYGKQVDVLARRPSDRALFEGKVANLLYSPGQLRDQMHEDRFANESSGSRFSDFSASSTGEFRNDGLSPSSQDTGYSSPSAHHSRNVSAENPQSQLPRRYSSSAPQIDFDGVHPQKVPSSVSFGSLDGSSMSHQSVVSSSLPAAPVERPVHSAVNRQTGASSVPHSTRSHASLPQTGSLSCSGGNLLSHKPVDSSSQTALARGPVQHGRVQVALVAPSSISVQTVTSTTQDLFFDQSTSQLPVTSTTSIDLFTGFNQEISSVSHIAVDSGSHANIIKGSQLPVTSTASIDLFAGFNQEISSVSHKAVDSGSHANVVKGPVHDTVVQKKVVSSSMPSQLTSSHPVHQDLFSLLAPQPPASSSPSIDLFAGFDQQPPSVPHVKQIPSTTPLPANEGWASFSTPQHGASTFVSNVQSQVPTVFPSSDSIAKGVDQLALPTLAPMPQQSALMADQWHLNAEEVKVTASNENPQSWNAFAESAESVPNNFFAFSNKPQEASHQCTIPSSPYVGSTNAKDLVPGEPEMSNPGDMFPGFNVTSGGVAGTFAPPQPMAGLMSQAGKSTNPFDMPCESDFEASEMFMDMSSLQSALPNPQSLTESWFPQNSALSYIPPGPQGGLSYMAGLPQESHILNSTPQGPFPPRNPFE